MKIKLGIGKNHMSALRDKKGNVTTSMNKMAKVVEEFYTDLYSTAGTTRTIMEEGVVQRI